MNATQVVAALSATAGPGAGPEEPQLWRSCEGDGTLGAQHLESRRARGVRSDLAREPGPGCELSPIFGDGLKDQAAAVWD